RNARLPAVVSPNAMMSLSRAIDDSTLMAPTRVGRHSVSALVWFRTNVSEAGRSVLFQITSDRSAVITPDHHARRFGLALRVPPNQRIRTRSWRRCLAHDGD